MSGLTRADLLTHIREKLFGKCEAESELTRYIGAELELIPFSATTGARSFPGGAGGTLDFLNSLASERQWTKSSQDPDPPRFETPRGETITFEPGGQIEISGPPLSSASEVIELMRETASLIEDAADRADIAVAAIGFDSRTGLADIPLQLRRTRYLRMTQYFDALGGSGIEMMRQTASLQVNVERGPDPVARWRLLNAMVPYLIAIFANSPLERDGLSHRSYRAHIWRTLDRRRSGMPWAHDAAEAYFAFAIEAPAILARNDDGFPTFGEWLRDGEPTIDDWTIHLSTLFPEIRPRDYFEIRSVDSLPPALLSVPIVLVAGVVYGQDAFRRASALLGDPEPGLLAIAGREGLTNSRIAARATELFRIALDGAQSLGAANISPSDLLEARTFCEEYTTCGRSPGDGAASLPHR